MEGLEPGTIRDVARTFVAGKKTGDRAWREEMDEVEGHASPRSDAGLSGLEPQQSEVDGPRTPGLRYTKAFMLEVLDGLLGVENPLPLPTGYSQLLHEGERSKGPILWKRKS